ncbi:putative his Kinase A (phosphoacceptor) domain containing protein [Lyophyllum shimeji]|uniref:histidine kinase n=1 Tax=Lyophyllum shimeji TaxID=47721 RepID=A0A9P3PRX3_LYOSH|nr:putative his Kinase A (phosphoacceptor) domain containing protein [Lyophyllum shimeji]
MSVAQLTEGAALVKHLQFFPEKILVILIFYLLRACFRGTGAVHCCISFQQKKIFDCEFSYAATCLVWRQTGEKSAPSNVASTTPITSTAVDDDSLPLPVLQKTGSRTPSSRRKGKSACIGGIAVHWARFKRRIGTGTAPSSGSVVEGSAAESIHTRGMEGTMQNNSDEVHEVVVDRVWSEDIKDSTNFSEHGATPEKSAGSHLPAPTTSDHESLGPEGLWSNLSPIVVLRWRLWPAVVELFSSRFADVKSEAHYAQENWFIKKSLALWASLWFILNWVLGCIFAQPITQVYDKTFYYGIAPALSLPVIFMVMYDWPRDRSNIYQTILIMSVWCWPFYTVLYIYLCGFYPNSPHVHLDCQGRDFLATFYYTTALQAIALFGLKLNRLPAAIGAGTFFVIVCSLMVPLKKTWVRSMINFFVFHGFLIYVHYMRESSERRLYTLRDQLKMQYKATQKAQINERKAADSKRRLTSYVFHEVRVPLNTALLAVQNMEASGAIAKEHEIEFNALEGSLSMMSKVLNDVLDFNRMDSGKFESASRPYGFHQVMRSLFIPLRLTTNARGLELETELDPRIDQVARRAAYEAMGESAEAINKHMFEHPDVDGVVIGDESRLRQIITNLTSNACKFTPAGGKLTIKTKLVMPASPTTLDAPSLTVSTNGGQELNGNGHHPLSATYLSRHNDATKPATPLEWIVVRIEVTDTGYGIKPRDLVQNKLFSAFNQTEQGRQQGGKGTGLGLALVRQIVKLSGGRLGVRSKVGEGSTFWVELPLGVGRKTLIHPSPGEVPAEESERCPRSGSQALRDIEKVHAVAGTKTSMPGSMSNSLTMADDAAALRASQMSSDSGQSSSAMKSLMEQGGRVELVLQRHGSRSPLQARKDAGSAEEAPDTISLSTNATAQRPATVHSQSSSSTARQVQRPTYVPLPSPRSFAMDIHPTSTSSSSNRSDQSSSSSPLTQFDSAYSRGSPSSSGHGISIEPGLPVLVVDDDPLTRTLMKRVLTRLGCEVATAENGEVALEMILGTQGMPAVTPSSDASGSTDPILEQKREELEITPEGTFAVVFLDNQMPVLSGLKTVKKLRELGRKDLVVGITGNALLTDQQEYLEAGVDRVLTKPVLERSIRDVLLLADERRKSLPSD